MKIHFPSRAPLSCCRLALAGLLMTLGIFCTAAAQSDYPSKPVRIIVGFAPGGGSDLIARLVATQMSNRLSQPVIVENRPGAGSNLGANLALKSPADGHTLFLAAASYTVSPSVYKLEFDAIKDMTPIAQLSRGPFIIAVNPQVPAHNLKELVALAARSPGELNYASAGAGSITHIVGEYFMDIANIDMLHVPYRGTAPALTDTVGGQTQLIFGTVASTLPFVKSGQLRALAVSTPNRLDALPDVPTAVESGFPAFSVTNWHGIIGPKGIPDDIVRKLNQVINDSLQDPAMTTTLALDGLTAANDTPEAFGTLLIEETERWGAVVKKRGIKVQ